MFDRFFFYSVSLPVGLGRCSQLLPESVESVYFDCCSQFLCAHNHSKSRHSPRCKCIQFSCGALCSFLSNLRLGRLVVGKRVGSIAFTNAVVLRLEAFDNGELNGGCLNHVNRPLACTLWNLLISRRTPPHGVLAK